MTRVTRAKYGVNRDGWWVLKDLLAGETAFGNAVEFNPDGATLRGRKVTTDYHADTSMGKLYLHPDTYAQFKSSVSRITYVVYSYKTPIAWCVLNETGGRYWVMPKLRYSVTTSKQQGRVFTAIRESGDVFLDE